MKLTPDPELIQICREIRDENLTIEQWLEVVSDDMFQSDHYCGGFEEGDEGDGAFWFSYYSPDGTEYWFPVTLDEAQKIAAGESIELDMRLAGT